jgi:protein-L-isoaspartate(D-aspartate) O-methyltransferase
MNSGRINLRSTVLVFAAITTMAAGVTQLSATDHDAELIYAKQRDALVRTIERHVRETSGYLGRATLTPEVVEALRKVPRHEFVPDRLRSQAYEDRPLPIGHEQTISQPYIVAIMTDLLDLEPGCKALDIGTGSGYQAAILAEICDSVWTIEIVEALGLEARARLERLGYENVAVRIGDGFHGWPEQQPFDAIVVAAVADEEPPPLLEQLKPGGRMIIPIRSGRHGEQLVLVEKHDDGQYTRRKLLPVRFVPLTGDHDRP